ncbi:MAG: Fic family protein [Nitrososphaerales archaeon]|nr:Fic family protein [Nitrososphaerales archaeon]
MVGSPVRHMNFDALILINREVVSLTGEKHEYTEEDERRIRSLLMDVEQLGVRGEYREEILAKVSLLIFRIASGQYFHEGNKRTALVAGLAFLQMNGYTLDIKDTDLVSVIDRAGISTATLNDVQAVLRRLVRDV